MGFLVKDGQWALELGRRKIDKHLLLPRMVIPSRTPDLHEEIRVEKDVAVPMRDGVRLYADVYRPKAEGAFPVILTRLSYGKGESYCYVPAMGRFWAIDMNAKTYRNPLRQDYWHQPPAAIDEEAGFPCDYCSHRRPTADLSYGRASLTDHAAHQTEIERGAHCVQ